MDRKINLFICYSNFQIYMAEIIANSFENHENILIKKKSGLSDYSFDKIYDIPDNSILKLLKLFSIKNRLNQYTDSAKKIQIFIPHTAGLLSQYAFKVLAKKPNTSVQLMYEGILFFYEYSQSHLENTASILNRKITSTLVNLNYEFNENIYPAFDEKIYKIYSPLPHLTIGPPSKMVKIKLPLVNFEVKGNTTVILSQKSTLMDGAQHLIWYKNIFEELKKRGISKIFYKAHLADDSNHFEIVAREYNFEIEYIKTQYPFEKILTDLKPNFVLSLVSSSLVNIKILYEDKIEVLAFVPIFEEKKPQHTNFDKITNVLKELNVNIKYFKV